MSIEDRALKALRSLMKEIGPGGRATKVAQDLRDRAERASVRLMDEVVSRIADRRVRTTGRKPWEAPEQLEAPKRPTEPSWRTAAGERTEDLFHPSDVVHSVEGSRPTAPVSHTNTSQASAAPVEAAPVVEAPAVEPTAEPTGVVPTGVAPAVLEPPVIEPLAEATSSVDASGVHTTVRPDIAAQELAPSVARLADELDKLPRSSEEPDDAITAPLPSRYRGDRLVFIARDPEWAHAYWSIDLSRINAAMIELGGGYGVLRLVDAETNVPLYEAETWAERGHYDLRVPWGDHAYRVELLVSHRGRSIVLERSVNVVMPPIMPRRPGEVRFVDLEAQRRILAASRELGASPKLSLFHALEPTPRASLLSRAMAAVAVAPSTPVFAVAPLTATPGPIEGRVPGAPKGGASEQLHQPGPGAGGAAGAAGEGAARGPSAPLGGSEGRLGGSEARLGGASERPAASTSPWGW